MVSANATGESHTSMACRPCIAADIRTIPAGLVRMITNASGQVLLNVRQVWSSSRSVRSAFAKPPGPSVSSPGRPAPKGNDSSKERAASPPTRTCTRITSAPFTASSNMRLDEVRANDPATPANRAATAASFGAFRPCSTISSGGRRSLPPGQSPNASASCTVATLLPPRTTSRTLRGQPVEGSDGLPYSVDLVIGQLGPHRQVQDASRQAPSYRQISDGTPRMVTIGALVRN